MEGKNILNPNPLVKFLDKPQKEFTKADIIRYIIKNEIEMINLRYVGADGRLKTLNFIINSLEHLDSILTYGERVDGSSLFPYIQAGSSDLYVIPRYRTAFLNPFSEIPAIDILCSYYTKDGKPLESAPEYTLRKAHEEFKKVTGMEFQAMGELEYYVISEKEDIFETPDQKGYHESVPFCKWANLRTEAMRAIAQTGGQIKYGHSEVGNFTIGNLSYEQNEIEFLPVDIEEAADQLVIAKWIMRTLAYQYGVDLTFAPKITTGTYRRMNSTSSRQTPANSKLPHRGNPNTSSTMTHTFRPVALGTAGSSSTRSSRATCPGSPRPATACSSSWPSSMRSSMSSS